ncbi:MAG: glycosyltransferase family 2 protein [candidate division Zixibacteria bacterium]|nr:glycosyltransferase family 2 protein [candidate division Zixibacteria bacterium]
MININQHSTLVIIPAYNAGKYLDELINRVAKFVSNENLLFINDGSTDNTLELLKAHKVKYINFEQNRGKGAGLMAGFEYAINNNYRSVLTLDADLQHLPEEIPKFIALENGKRFILGVRNIDLKTMPISRFCSNNMTSIIISIFSTKRMRDTQTGYRLIPVSFLKTINLKTTGYDLESEMLFKAGKTDIEIAEVFITTVYEDSHSYINPLLDTARFIKQMWKRIWM